MTRNLSKAKNAEGSRQAEVELGCALEHRAATCHGVAERNSLLAETIYRL